MKKKLLSAILAGAMVIPTVVLPTSVGAAEEANDSGTITITYSPENYLIYYGTKYSGYYKYEYESMAITKNYIPKRQDNGAYAWPRTDQDKIYSQYKIMAPEAIVDVDINIQNMKFAMYKDVIKNTISETGEVQTSETVRDAVANFSLYYSTSMNDLPEGQEYGWYYTTKKDESTKTYVGGEPTDVDALLSKWKSDLSSKTVSPVLIETIAPSTFGVQPTKEIVWTQNQTDGVNQGAKTRTKNELETMNVSYDITDTVKQALVDGKNENGEVLFDVIYGTQKNSKNDYYVGDISTWYNDTTLTVIYDKDLIAADVSTAADVDELIAKLKAYAPLVGFDVSLLNDEILAEKLPKYVGTTFTWDSFEALLESVMPVDITQHQVDISDMFNASNWAYEGETIDADTLFLKSASSGMVFAQNATVKDTYQLKAVDVKDVYLRTTNDKGETLATPYYDSKNVENGDVIDFKFDPATYHANENNVLYIWRGTSETIDGFARHADKIYLLSALMGNHRQTLPITVKYTDGTEETVKVWMENRGQKQVVKDVEGYDGTHGAVFTAWPNYAGDMGVNGNRIGNMAWNRAEIASAETESFTTPNGLSFNKAKEGATVTKSSADGGPLFWSADVDETKIIENITLSSVDATLELYAIGESVISNDEMRAYIANVEKIEEVTSENSAEIFVAKAYKEELKMRNVAKESDFATLNALIADAEWYADKKDSEQYMVDLSDFYDMDVLAPKGSLVEKAWTNTLNSTYTPAWTAAAATNASGTTYAKGIRTVNEAVYTENEDGTYTFANSGEAINFSTPETMFEAGVKDVVALFEGEEGTTIPASGERVEKVYFLWDATGSSQNPRVTVNYEDGTSETTKMYIGGYSWTYANPGNLAKKLYPNLAGAMWLAWNTYNAVKANEADEYYTVVQKDGNVYGAVNMWSLALDPTKKVISYTITPDADDNNPATNYDTYLYAMTEKTMSNEDMMAVIDEAKKLEYVSTEEDAELAKTAAVYARELDERHAVKLGKNLDVLGLEEQAVAQEIKYLDLSAQADEDIIVKSGDTEKYASRDDSVLIDFSEYVTAVAPANTDYLDEETGTVFKLFGGWDGKGNDAVRVIPADENGEGVVIDLNGEMYKHISFLADSIDADVNPLTGATIYADVLYTDGETETVEATLRRGDSWYTNQQAAHYNRGFGSWNAEEGKYVNTTWVTGGNSVPEYAAAYPGRSHDGVAVFGFDIPSMKTVSSIKLNPHEKAEYAIIGATAVPYTNDELVADYDEFLNLELTEVDEVTAENAEAVIKGYSALKELYERNYQYAWAEDVEYFAPLYAEALKFNIEVGTLQFSPSIVVENGNVTANVTMINTTEDDQDYILIIAAYDANNQLVGVKSTDQATLESMTYAGSDSVTMAVPQGATNYKALVWESKDSMNPLAMIEK